MFKYDLVDKLLYLINFSFFFILSFSVTTCSGDQFRCLDGICLNIDKRCNGIADCRNGEDENQCGKLICFPSLFETCIYSINLFLHLESARAEYINEIFLTIQISTESVLFNSVISVF